MSAIPLMNLGLRGQMPLPPPRRRFTPLPVPLEATAGVDPRVRANVERRRAEIAAAIRGGDPRFLAFVGPCSVHDPAAAREYLGRLAALEREVRSHVIVVPRLFFEKPRTTLGWTGLAADPHLDASGDAAQGIRLARALLCEAAEMGLPAVTELLTPQFARYAEDLLAAAAIGARTSESQPHRQEASGLPCPVGFKNSMCGSVGAAVSAALCASSPHSFLSNDDRTGAPAVAHTRGNPDAFVILRGARSGPNFDEATVRSTGSMLAAAGFESRRIVIDASHGNCVKDHRRQAAAFRAALGYFRDGVVCGAMLESFLDSGAQKIPENLAGFDRSRLAPNQSVTDACIGWEETEALLREAAGL